MMYNDASVIVPIETPERVHKAFVRCGCGARLFKERLAAHRAEECPQRFAKEKAPGRRRASITVVMPVKYPLPIVTPITTYAGQPIGPRGSDRLPANTPWSMQGEADALEARYEAVRENAIFDFQA